MSGVALHAGYLLPAPSAPVDQPKSMSAPRLNTMYVINSDDAPQPFLKADFHVFLPTPLTRIIGVDVVQVLIERSSVPATGNSNVVCIESRALGRRTLYTNPTRASFRSYVTDMAANPVVITNNRVDTFLFVNPLTLQDIDIRITDLNGNVLQNVTRVVIVLELVTDAFP